MQTTHSRIQEEGNSHDTPAPGGSSSGIAAIVMGSLRKKAPPSGKIRRPIQDLNSNLISLWREHILASDGVERKLHTAGNPELVIDIAQVISNRVFGNAHLMTDLAGAHALCQQVHDFRFAWCKKTHATAGFDDSQGLELREELEEEDEILVVGPNLPAMHRSNALGQQLERVDEAENAFRTASKCVDHQFTVANRNHHNRRCFWTRRRQTL